jgi:hypothetical protein
MVITTPRVARWLQSLPDDGSAAIVDTVANVAADPDVPNPRCKRLASNLWEARLTLAYRRQARVMFGYRDGEPVMLTGLVKRDAKRHTLEIFRARRALEAT